MDPKLITWHYPQPQPFASPASNISGGVNGNAGTANAQAAAAARNPMPWQLPEIRRPAFCDALDSQNAAFLKYDNHPCTFLAWPDAAAGPGGPRQQEAVVYGLQQKVAAQQQAQPPGRSRQQDAVVGKPLQAENREKNGGSADAKLQAPGRDAGGHNAEGSHGSLGWLWGY